ncbi:thiamine/thiamine pyrophosphate ABC transporter permease ThiP [uncultured Cohaesibacter sp.]|uniref:thiamine/thiamine pyrophosphate ABC transporter permease ThiP n=1 Tax=uncultured Cohaesibacter sp. TaxID=1002546 RepID=UPI00292E6E69|nr:thiamine/thiamine pyrophosphate ABC transporter permease ThiP [uncultured Cohaesibacter sp.]
MTDKASRNAFAFGIPATIAFIIPLGLVVVSLWALWSVTTNDLATEQAGGRPLLSHLIDDIYLRRALTFTLTQATLSAILSTLLAIPLARALATRSFPGRSAILSFFGAPFILPVIVAILGLLSIWGNKGPVQAIMSAFGFENFSIYGLWGILIAHVFFNLPLATRILLQGWLALPAEQWRLASQLGMNSASIARYIEWPMLKERLPGILALVFLLCTTSFTVILALGGGPRATTIELAIYQAIRFDFDMERAALLAFLQIILCAGLALVSRVASTDFDTGQSLGGAVLRTDRNGRLAQWSDGAIIMVAVAFLGMPLLSAFIRGIWGLGLHGIDWGQILPAALRSTGVSLASCLVMLLISLPLAQLSIHIEGKARRFVELPGYAIMVAPPIALGAGLFILLHQHVSVDDLALPLTALLNGLQAVPFALILLTPAMAQIKRNYGMQLRHLGIKRRDAIRIIHWPLMRKPLGLSLGIAAALSIGDLGVIALFGSPSAPTLPLYLYQQLGAYRMDQAYGTGVLLTSIAFAFFVLFDKGLGGRDQT